jgi:hypothetical protein
MDANHYIRTLNERIKELEGHLGRFVEDSPCNFDHHGYCQAHCGGCAHEGSCTTENCPGLDCANAAARKALGLDKPVESVLG